jgi:uncharacterized Fe-S cluster protein YjdI
MSDQPSKEKTYTNGEVTIVWKPDSCVHSAKCVNGLPEVFNAKAKPWINAQGASTQQIVDQVKKCPSGALSYFLNASADSQAASDSPKAMKVDMLKDGPLILEGDIVLCSPDGNKTTKTGKTALCRCGASNNKPFCDGAHRKVGFKA